MRDGRDLKVPYMGNGNRELDVAEPFATHLGLGHFDATAIANNTAIADPLVTCRNDRSNPLLVQRYVHKRDRRAPA